MESDLTEETQAEPQEPDISLEILPLIREVQGQHGLRHGDYQRYRMYCSRRLRRIRKSLNFSQGHRNRYQKKTVTVEKITDARFLCIELVCAERAWAAGMELKQSVNSEPRKRFHLVRRLNRGKKHATQLSKLCEDCPRCDARTRLEAQAYCSWMQGVVMFERQMWQEALQSFTQSQTIYEKLASAVPGEQKAIYHQRVEEISPNMRYCVYNIGDTPTDINQLMEMRSISDMLASKINLVLAKTQEKAASSLTEILWLGTKVPVRSEKVRVSLVKLQLVEGRLGSVEEEGKMEVYESLLMECQDSMQITREELVSETAALEKKRTVKAEVQVGQIQAILDYLSHIKHTHAIHRNLLLLRFMKSHKEAIHDKSGAVKAGSEKATKPEEFVRVYDILLQHATELGDIPGQSSEDLARQKENAARIFAFKAFRCFYLAESYVVIKKWEESMGLFNHTLQHVTQALEHYRELKSEIENTIDKIVLPELVKLKQTIPGRKCVVHVKSILEAETPEEDMSNLSLSSKPLTERLYQFDLSSSSAKPVLAPFPPNYKSIPCKPLFFDLALNHIEYPSLDHRVEKKGGGITGFVKSLFWRQS